MNLRCPRVGEIVKVRETKQVGKVVAWTEEIKGGYVVEVDGERRVFPRIALQVPKAPKFA